MEKFLKILGLIFILLISGCSSRAPEFQVFIDRPLQSPLALVRCGPNFFIAENENATLRLFDGRGRHIRDIPGFDQIMDLTCANNIAYAADFGADLIYKLDPDGKILARFGGSGRGPGKFGSPAGVAVGPNWNIYVSEFYNHRVQVLDARGRHVRFIGRKGKKPGEFHYPTGVFAGPDGRLHVADAYNNRIQIFRANGAFLGELSAKKYGWNVPTGAVYSERLGHIIADGGNHRVVLADKKGRSRLLWKSDGLQKRTDKIHSPSRIFLDEANGMLYIPDALGNRVIRGKLLPGSGVKN